MHGIELGVALAVATIIPLVFLVFIITRNLYATSSADAVVMCFVWGIIAFCLTLGIHNLLIRETDLTFLTLIRYLAPASEEILKALILLILVRRTDFTYFVDGAVYGFSTGIGFAIVESYSYILDREAAVLTIATGRTLSCILVHATASALVGVTLGLARFERTAVRRLSTVIGGLLIAMLVHGGFNNLITRVRVSTPLLYTYAAAVGVGGAILILLIIRRGLAEERAWIEEMLGMTDRVTEGEVKIVRRLAEAGVILAPLAEKFGREKATQIGRFLVLQARLGITRKVLEKLPDEPLRRDTQAQFEAIKKSMVAARRAVGVYPMLFLRSIFPEENRSVWRRLEVVIGSQPDEVSLSAADLMGDFSVPQRRVIRAMLRKRGRTSRADLNAELDKLPAERRLTPEQIDTALESLSKEGWLFSTGQSPVLYKVNLRRKAGLTLTQDIWAALDERTLDSDAGEFNLWDELRDRLDEQVATRPATEGMNLWTVLAQRIPEN